MPRPVLVKVASQTVVRESDGVTLLLVETWCGQREDRPLTVQVVESQDEEG